MRTPLTIRENFPNIQDHTKREKDWDIEASFPKSHSATSVDGIHKEKQLSCIQKEFKANDDALKFQDSRYESETMDDKPDSSSLSELISESCETKHVAVNNDHRLQSNFANITLSNSEPVSEEIDSEGFRAMGRKSLDSIVTEAGFQGICNCCSHANAELTLIRTQLLDIETKQSKLLDLLEIFMGNTMGSLSTLQLKVHNLEGTIDEMAQIFERDESFTNMTGFEHLKRNQSVFSSPRLSTCTPRSSVDANKPDTTISVNRRVLCGEKSISRCGSISSTKDEKIARNQVEMDMYNAVGRNQAKENRNLLSVLNSDVDPKKVNLDVESAYKEALSCGDDVTLLALMVKTGPVLEKLSLVTADKIVNTLTRQFQTKGFMSSVIPWLQQVVDLSCLHTMKQPLLSWKTQMDFLYALKGMAEHECINSEHKMFIAQVVARLKREWGEAPSRRIPLSMRPNGSNRMVNSARV